MTSPVSIGSIHRLNPGPPFSSYRYVSWPTTGGSFVPPSGWLPWLLSLSGTSLPFLTLLTINPGGQQSGPIIQLWTLGVSAIKTALLAISFPPGNNSSTDIHSDLPPQLEEVSQAILVRSVPTVTSWCWWANEPMNQGWKELFVYSFRSVILVYFSSCIPAISYPPWN